MKKILYLSVSIIVVLIIGIVVYVNFDSNRSIESSLPLEVELPLEAETDEDDTEIIPTEINTSYTKSVTKHAEEELEIARRRAKWHEEHGGINPSESEEIYAEGKTIKITRDEFEFTAIYYEVMAQNKDTSKNEILNYLAERKLLYNLAIENDYEAKEEEVERSIETYKDFVRLYEEQYEEKSILAIMMEGFESEEAYWEYLYETQKRVLSMDKYIRALREEKMAEWGIEADEVSIFFESDKRKEWEDQWNNYYEEFINELIEQEEMKIL